MLFIWLYGQRTGEDLEIRHKNTVTLQKWANLYDIMLEKFKGKCHYVTMDSTYMDRIMTLIGHHGQKVNMMGTANEDKTDVDTVEEKRGIRKNFYRAVMWYHVSKSLCYAIWSDNNLVYILSNFHTPKVVIGGFQRTRKVNGACEMDPADVPCPQQNTNYSDTFYLINKGNSAEAKYDLSGQSRKHWWSHTLSLWLVNMNFKSSYYRIYMALMEKHNPERHFLSISKGIKEAAHAFLQSGEDM